MRVPGVSGLPRSLTLGVVAVLLLAAVLVVRLDDGRKHLTASFPRAISVYEGSDVRILGVTVGEVEKVVPSGTTVEVTMWYDAAQKVPADAKAVVVAPAVVGDRFVQLTPVYEGGALLPDGARLGPDRTATPLELDEIYQSISDLSVALGPEGANRAGALTRLLDSTARNFSGNGRQLNETVTNLGRLTGTLANNKDELFGTAREVQRFVHALARNDRTVRDFNDSLAAAAGLLEAERDDLAASLRNLGVAMEEVSSFVRENRETLSSNIKGLNRLSRTLVDQRAALEETLVTAPTALSNLFHTYNPSTGTLDTRANMPENLDTALTDPALALCTLLASNDDSGRLCDVVEGVLGGGLPAPRVAPGPAARAGRDRRVVEVEQVDPTLAGLLEVRR